MVLSLTKSFVFCEFLGQTDRHPALRNASTVDTYLPNYLPTKAYCVDYVYQ